MGPSGCRSRCTISVQAFASRLDRWCVPFASRAGRPRCAATRSLVDDPYPVYRRLRDEAPRLPRRRARPVGPDPLRRRAGRPRATGRPIASGEPGGNDIDNRAGCSSPRATSPAVDPPTHDRIRAVLHAAFRPSRGPGSASSRVVRPAAIRLVDRFADRGQADLATRARPPAAGRDGLQLARLPGGGPSAAHRLVRPHARSDPRPARRCRPRRSRRATTCAPTWPGRGGRAADRAARGPAQRPGRRPSATTS